MAGTSETRRDPHPDRSEWPWWLMAADDEMSLDTLEKKILGYSLVVPKMVVSRV